MKVAFLLLIFTALSFTAYAQACGGHKTTLAIVDKLGRPIDRASIEIASITKDEIGGKRFEIEGRPNVFTIMFPEHVSIKETYALYIRATGFSDIRREIKFTNCEQVELKIEMSPGESSLTYSFRGTVYDENHAVVPGVIVKAVSDKSTVEAKTNYEGVYDLDLKVGKYTITFAHSAGHFCNVALKNYWFAGNMNFDIVLIPQMSTGGIGGCKDRTITF